MDRQTMLDTLKSTLQGSGAAFSAAWNLFFDLSESAGFMTDSHPARLDRLAPALEAVARTREDRPRRVFRAPAIMRYGDSAFYHGTIACPGYTGTFMYFEDIDAGMLALTDVRLVDVEFFRLALTPVRIGP